MLPINYVCAYDKTSLVPSPTPSFPSLLSTLYRTKQRRKAGRGTGNEAMTKPHSRYTFTCDHSNSLRSTQHSDVNRCGTKQLCSLSILEMARTSFFQLRGYSFSMTCAYDHTTLNTPVLVRSPKLSSVGPV